MSGNNSSIIVGNCHMKTEDQVRDGANILLGFNDKEKNVQQGTGQITTFNQLGFRGNSNKPDGWYLPNDKGMVAIVLETKSEKEDISKDKWVNELQKNINIVREKYSKVIGLLYNGVDIRVFKNDEEITGVASTLQHKDYYKKLFLQQRIDKQRIYRLTKQINDTLHTEFGIKNLYHRMIFTACALVAKRYGALLNQGMDFPTLKQCILSSLTDNIKEDLKKNLKLEYLINVYKSIEMNNDRNQEAINNFISWISVISECVYSDYWNGEDVMGIFFNEFNRYKKKSESGQVFTPDHITSFMYRLIDVNKDDFVLDAACGSGAFLMKSMCNMIREVGGVSTIEACGIKENQLFGIEFDKEIFALACANMLIHKDGKTNLEQMDSRTEEASKWIKSKRITKVLMNPPFETKYGCLKIVKNVLDSVPQGTKCAFILPDKKLEKNLKDKKYGNKLLKNNRLTTIVKFPENLFFGQGVTTSVFVFIAGVPQNGCDIVGYYIEEDGLETVKNQGRHDIKNLWKEKEDYWIRAIQNGEDSRYNTRQIIHPNEHLSYQIPEKPFEIFKEDFVRTMTDFELYKRKIDTKEFEEKLLRYVLYNSTIDSCNDNIIIQLNGGEL